MRWAFGLHRIPSENELCKILGCSRVSVRAAIQKYVGLNVFVEEAVCDVNANGGKAARYFATDMCDGMAQGHDGINYSLAPLIRSTS